MISVVDGRKRVRRGVHRPIEEWDVLIKDHHAAYITWDEFERNLKAIANNATGMSSALARGAAREGELLLPGLLRCGHCGRKLHVHYGGKLGRYNCYGARMNHGAKRCISVSGLSIDAAIAKEILRVLKPLGMEAAVKAIEAQTSETRRLSGNWSCPCSRHATKPRTRVDSTTPLIRQIGWSRASWSADGTRLCKLLQRLKASSPPSFAVSPRTSRSAGPEHQQLMALGADLERAWSHPAATAATRKRIIRAASRRSSCAGMAQSSMRSCTGKAAIIPSCK